MMRERKVETMRTMVAEKALWVWEGRSMARARDQRDGGGEA
jgi:hypothetical protein